MPAHIVVRETTKGAKRYLVRARPAGRYGRLLHLGSFRTRREAEACRAWAALELAAGRVPDRRTMLSAQAVEGRTLRQAAEAWVASRVDLRASTRSSYLTTIQRAAGAALPLWSTSVERLALADLQAFVASLLAVGASPQTIRRDLNVVKQTLDYIGIDPNPARDRKLRLPARSRVAPDPPSAREVALIIEHATKRYRLVIALLEATGLRVSELLRMTWGDVDLAESRFRVPRGKSTRARRFVSVPDELMAHVSDLCPLEDRSADRRLFAGMGREVVTAAMARACKLAGIPLYSPHDLRHRQLSRLVQGGMTIPEVQQRAGHARASTLLDTYTHVLVDQEDGWRLAHDCLT